MDEVLHANIFFFIASGATILFMLLGAIALYQVIKILKTIRTIVERVEAGSDQLAQDMINIRSLVASGGIISRVVGFFMPAAPRRRKRTRVKVDEV